VTLTLVMTILAGMILVSIVMLSLNHYFYMRRRLTDVRLESIHEVNWLLAQYLTNWITDRDYVPCLLYTSPSPRDLSTSRMPSSA